MRSQPQFPESFARGLALFNHGRFFDAHEELEDAWRATRGEARLFLQGITQAAVALHHYSTGNLAGARSVLARALRNLDGYPSVYGGVELEQLRRELRAFHFGILEGSVGKPVPRIALKSAGG